MDYSKPKHKYNRYNTELCDNTMTFQDCELAVLRHAVDEGEEKLNKQLANGKEIERMISIVQDFLVRKKLVCYGGTAINNILPKFAQFYDRETEIPDYDFYSANALQDAKELADIYFAEGYDDVEAKSGVHFGTYKVFVNFIPMADITLLPKPLFEILQKEAITIAGIKYAPANFLRMNMFLELSRPAGDLSRWEKVLKRLTLLNTYYPFTKDTDCVAVDFQRKMESHKEDSEKIYMAIRDTFIDLGVIFFGGYASSLYSKYMPSKQQTYVKNVPDFDVLYEDPERAAIIVVEKLTELGIKGIKIIKHEEIGEIVPPHLEIRIGKETVAFIYKPIACHNYNTITVGQKEINVATIDTILTFYLAFYYVDKPYYDQDRILCMAKFLFELEQKNRLEQKGLLKRYSISCYGKQLSLEDIRAEKALKFKELANKRDSEEYQMWFLKYNPADIAEKKNKGKPVISKKIDQEPLVKSIKHDIRNAVNPDVEVMSATPEKSVKSSTKLEAKPLAKSKAKSSTNLEAKPLTKLEAKPLTKSKAKSTIMESIKKSIQSLKPQPFKKNTRKATRKRARKPKNPRTDYLF